MPEKNTIGKNYHHGEIPSSRICESPKFLLDFSVKPAISG